jgi:hypothetical protein
MKANIGKDSKQEKVIKLINVGKMKNRNGEYDGNWENDEKNGYGIMKY